MESNNYSGTTRITNPKTLKRWIDFGWYDKIIEEGFIFNPYCGRFKTEICTCSACRSKRLDKSELIKLMQ